MGLMPSCSAHLEADIMPDFKIKTLICVVLTDLIEKLHEAREKTYVNGSSCVK